MASNLTSDTSQTVFGIGDPLPEPLRIILIIAGFILCFVGVPGNLLVIASILKVKALRVRLNMFILNLAICDMLITGYIYPFTVADLISGKYPGTEDICMFNSLAVYMVFTAEVVNITVIGISRYTKVCWTSVFYKVFDRKGTLMLCITSWILGAITAIHFIVNRPAVIYLKSIHACIPQEPVTRIVIPVVLLLSYTVTSLCYWKTWKAVRESDRRIINHGNETFARLRHNLDRPHILSNFIIFILYIFLQTPSAITFFVFPNTPGSVQTTFYFLCAVNSSVNCIVYGLMNKNFKRSYGQVLPNVRFIQVQPVPVNS